MNALFYFLLIIRRPHRSTPTATLSPYTTLSRSGTVEQTGLAEFGRTALSITAPDSTLFHGLPAQQSVWMSHGDSVSAAPEGFLITARTGGRSEEHTSELQSLMRISYDVFCLHITKSLYSVIHIM